MVVTIDLNVILDVFLARDGYVASLELLTLCKDGKIRCCLPSHGVPTIYYLLKKNLGHERAIETVTSLIDFIDIVPVSKATLRTALEINLSDFEDSVIVASALESKSEFIITSNLKDFKASPVSAISAEQFMRETAL